MKIHKFLFAASLFGALFGSQTALATPPAPSATSIVATAETKAASENKNVLVLFHASWCGWCHKLDNFLDQKEIAPLIDANYVTVHIVVQESEDKKDLDNPGGDELLNNLGGKDLGIPFYAILSPKNETLAVSKNDKGQNIGYPGEDDEITLFMKMLRTTSNHLSDSDASLIETKLHEAGKKIAAENALTMKLYKPIQDAMGKKDYEEALKDCDDVISTHPDQAASAYYYRYEALIHVDEKKALSEIGQPMGANKKQQADQIRAGMIVSQDSLSDKAYRDALSILKTVKPTGANRWYVDRQLALANGHLHQYKTAIQYEGKAIDEAKAANLPSRVIEDMEKSESEWKKAQ